MGVPRLKIKIELNYRRGSTAFYCSDCNHFTGDFYVFGTHSEFLRKEPRCWVIGLGHSRRYRIGEKNICDAFDNSSLLKRLGVGE